MYGTTRRISASRGAHSLLEEGQALCWSKPLRVAALELSRHKKAYSPAICRSKTYILALLSSLRYATAGASYMTAQKETVSKKKCVCNGTNK